MNQDTERELKLMLTEEEYSRLNRALHFDQEREQINTYYDTPARSLLDQMTAIRIRQTQGKNILTIKKPQDAISKYEFEKEIHTPDMKSLNREETEWISDHGIDPKCLVPVIQFSTIRKIIDTENAEISLDENHFAHHTDYEIEYEYRRDHDGIRCFNEFLKPIGLHYEKNGPGKYARALSDQHQFNENL